MDWAGGAQRPVFVLMSLKSRVRGAHVRTRAAKTYQLFNIFICDILVLWTTLEHDN